MSLAATAPKETEMYVNKESIVFMKRGRIFWEDSLNDTQTMYAGKMLKVIYSYVIDI